MYDRAHIEAKAAFPYNQPNSTEMNKGVRPPLNI